MNESPRPKRAYNSARRQAQARQTRQQIADAALKLFAERGYTGATIEAIALEADVAPETVSAVFGNKRRILSHLLELSAGGEDGPIRFVDRPEPQAIFAEKDQRRQLLLFAQCVTQFIEHMWPISEIMSVAAKTEPDVAQLNQHAQKERWQDMFILVQHIAANGPLREGLDHTEAANTVWILTSHHIFRLLTAESGWSNSQYCDWLGDSLIRLLLP